ncbi:MAG TPA: P-loop NTPase fold protein [Chitinophagaceae bacterium]|nr:P-loop NTPase fold protein [Chitinophagaceae bacterium]
MSTTIVHYQWRKYFEEVGKSYRYLIVALTIFLLFFFFREPILKFFLEALVVPIISGFSKGSSSEFFMIIIFLIMAGYFSVNLYKKRIPSPKSLFNVLLLLLIYFLLIRDEKYFEFYSFSFWKNLFYSDIIILSVSIFLLRFKNYSSIKVQQDPDGFVEDRLYEINSIDFLTRRAFAKDIAHHISHTVNNKAFAISIIGNWGSGKTIFLQFLEEELKKQENNEILRFNPWKSTDSKLMINDFFATLANGIKKYDKNGSDEIRSYGKYLAGLKDGILNKIVENLTADAEKDLSVSDKYEEIENSIVLTGKRFVVFIDDSDRLTGKELIQVLKIIRNTANFKNIIFITALDPNYAISALRNTKELTSEAEYLEKIFQLEIVLPPISKVLLYRKLLELLEVEKMPAEEKQEFTNALRFISNNDQADFFFMGRTMYSGMFERIFTTLRDIVRFVNSFKIRYRILKGEVDLYDLFVLEMIKLKSIGIYNLLSQKKILDFKENATPDQYCLNEAAFDKLYEDKNNPLNLDENSKEDIKRLLDNLLSYSDKYKTNRSIIYPLNFSIYVNYQLIDNVSLKEFRVMSEKSDNEFFDWVIKAYNDNKGESVDSIIGNFYEFESLDQFKKYILLFLRLATYNNNYVTHVLGILKESETVIKRYFGGDVDAASTYIKKLFLDERIAEPIKIEMGSIFTREAFEYQKEYYLDQQTWQDIILTSFKRFKEASQEIRNVDFGLYLKNWSGLGPERKIIIYQPANEFFRECIEKDKIGYLKHVLRSYYNPPGDVFTFDPFIDNIFGSQAAFEEFLNDIQSKDKFIEMVKKYYPAYKENDFREFVIKDKKDRDFILDEIKKLQ